MHETIKELNRIEIQLVELKHRLRSLLTLGAYNDIAVFSNVTDIYNGAYESMGNEFRAFLLKVE